MFHDREMDRYLSGNRSSVHEVSLADLLDIARLSECLPEPRCLIGIEPASLEWGEQPSEMVAPSIDLGIEEILSILRGWNLV